jgi:hypothetical protein
MPSYWWQCDTCQIVETFSDVCDGEATGIVTFIRNVLVPSDWDQSKLILRCPKCGKRELRITYDFPRQDDPVRLHAVHIIGLTQDDSDLLSMMWETQPDTVEETWFDFKYVNGNSIWGLNKSGVFNRSELKRLFKTYEEKCGGGSFP